MNRIATIISALIEATQTVATDQWGIDHRVCCGTEIGYPHESDCLWMYALAHAHELKALKPVGEIVCEDLGKPFNAMQIRMHFYDFTPSIGTKLYTLDEVKHD